MLDSALPSPPRATLPALAEAVAGWFPELQGRAIAVSEAKITKENVPGLPLAMVALAKETAKHNPRSNSNIPLSDDLVIEFWQQVERYRRADGSESPFWAYYDFEPVRDTLLFYLRDWRSPRGGKLRYVSMDIDADDWAVALTFRFEHEFDWCDETVLALQPLACEVEVAVCLIEAPPPCADEPEPECPPGTRPA